MALPQRAFSNFGQIEKAQQKLSKALESEVKYENENYSQLEDIENFLNESGFQFSESDGGLTMTLKKTIGERAVTVSFDARQPLPDEQPEGAEEDEEYDMPSENYCDFTVFVGDVEGNSGLVVEATTMDTEIAINNVMSSGDLEKAQNTARFERSISEYVGPDFTTLDERIQQSLTEYLEGFGVNEQLAAFVECMSLDKDQRLYMKWLGQVKEFVEA
uniref:Uncharacterized protein n=1 Tax=Strombidium inclinatum TaxID=197538 RepID=A0A7S3MVU1_9SPIT